MIYECNLQFTKTKCCKSERLRHLCYMTCIVKNASRTVIDVRNQVMHRTFNTKWWFIVLDWHSKLTEKSNLIGRQTMQSHLLALIWFIDNLAVAYYFGPPCIYIKLRKTLVLTSVHGTLSSRTVRTLVWPNCAAKCSAVMPSWRRHSNKRNIYAQTVKSVTRELILFTMLWANNG